jgi:dihydroorotase
MLLLREANQIVQQQEVKCPSVGLSFEMKNLAIIAQSIHRIIIMGTDTIPMKNPHSKSAMLCFPAYSNTDATEFVPVFWNQSRCDKLPHLYGQSHVSYYSSTGTFIHSQFQSVENVYRIMYCVQILYACFKKKKSSRPLN